MFHVDPDAWATIVAVLIVCISIFVSIARKLQRKRKKAPLLWYTVEIGTSLLAALMAYEMHPHMTAILPGWMTQAVFMGVCVHMGSRLIQKLEDKTTL
jgi:FtsH-binding integral membrane protein